MSSFIEHKYKKLKGGKDDILLICGDFNINSFCHSPSFRDHIISFHPGNHKVFDKYEQEYNYMKQTLSKPNKGECLIDIVME
jgi:hypothetical protein